VSNSWRGAFVVPLVFSVLTLGLGLACSLWWNPVFHDTSYWMTPNDFWATYRGAHFVGWGDLGDVYRNGTGLITFPGIIVLLAPVAMLTGALGMSEGFPLAVAHPTAWLSSGRTRFAKKSGFRR
jgi:hypothetical protein